MSLRIFSFIYKPFGTSFRHLFIQMSTVFGLLFSSIGFASASVKCFQLVSADSASLEPVIQNFRDMTALFKQYRQSGPVLAHWESLDSGARQKLQRQIKDNYEILVRAKNSKKSVSSEIKDLKRVMDSILTSEISQHLQQNHFPENKMGLELYRKIYEMHTRTAGIQNPVAFEKMLAVFKVIQSALRDTQKLKEAMEKISLDPRRYDPAFLAFQPTWKAADQLYVDFKRGKLSPDLRVSVMGSAVVGRGVRDFSDLDFESGTGVVDRLLKNVIAENENVKRAVANAGLTDISTEGIYTDNSTHLQTLLRSMAFVEITPQSIDLLVQLSSTEFKPIRIPLELGP